MMSPHRHIELIIIHKFMSFCNKRKKENHHVISLQEPRQDQQNKYDLFSVKENIKTFLIINRHTVPLNVFIKHSEGSVKHTKQVICVQLFNFNLLVSNIQ